MQNLSKKSRREYFFYRLFKYDVSNSDDVASTEGKRSFEISGLRLSENIKMQLKETESRNMDVFLS
jgi:hypothetical protein